MVKHTFIQAHRVERRKLDFLYLLSLLGDFFAQEGYEENLPLDCSYAIECTAQEPSPGTEELSAE